MALSATVYSFEITLNDADRGVYEALSFRAARHPSETEEYLLTRVLAYCLEYRQGIAFSKGLSDPAAPALEIRDLTGTLQSWIDIGTPDPSRLHRATKAAPRVAVYSHKDVAALLAGLAAGKVHRADEIEIYALDRGFLAALAARLGRRMGFDLAVTERSLYLSFDDQTLSASVTPHRVGSAG
ncbi:MAG: YaeQ family protein [Steroidobacterales bacterium]